MVLLRKWDYGFESWKSCMGYIMEISFRIILKLKNARLLATSMGMTVQTLHNYKLLADMIPGISGYFDTTKLYKVDYFNTYKNLILKAGKFDGTLLIEFL